MAKPKLAPPSKPHLYLPVDADIFLYNVQLAGRDPQAKELMKHDSLRSHYRELVMARVEASEANADVDHNNAGKKAVNFTTEPMHQLPVILLTACLPNRTARVSSSNFGARGQRSDSNIH